MALALRQERRNGVGEEAGYYRHGGEHHEDHEEGEAALYRKLQAL